MATELDFALESVHTARDHLKDALEVVKRQSDLGRAEESLTGMVGELARLTQAWERERDRWR